jgi:hypothetical protein
MIVRFIIPWKRHNPAYKPPDPRGDMAGWMTYKYRVPLEIEHPAGTEIDDPWAWIHCLPNSAGIIIAEPVDDDAKLMVEGESKSLSPKAKRILDAHNARREALRLQAEAAKPVEVTEKTEEASA